MEVSAGCFKKRTSVMEKNNKKTRRGVRQVSQDGETRHCADELSVGTGMTGEEIPRSSLSDEDARREAGGESD